MIQAICWTLVHSLWQGLLFAMATGLVMLLTRRASAAVRYNILCGLFFLFLGVCACTFLYEWSMAGSALSNNAVLLADETRGWVVGWIETLGRYCSDHAVLIVWTWLFVFAVKSLRMLGGFLYTQRIRHYGVSAAPAGWQQKVNDLCRELGIDRAVKLVESRIVKMPLVTGHWRPVIFMPLGLLTGLPEGEIEAVLLHELAHIRRNDYLVNFVQHVAGNLLFFNPGFLWISALLRDERENCCDDIAIDRTRDRVQFVRALISFKEHDLRMAKLANAFPARKNQLLKRVSRIVHNTNKTLDPAEKVFLVVSFALISLLVAATTNHSPAAAVQVAQMPRGKFRVIIDSPATVAGREPAIKEVEPVEEMEPPVVYKRQPVKRQVKAILPERDEIAAVQQIQVQRFNADEQRQDEMSRQQASQQAMRDAEQVVRDKEQAERDAQQAIHDREQAVRDKLQADRDVEQAIRDKKQAERDAHQAVLDKLQAEKDAAQAMKDARRVQQ